MPKLLNHPSLEEFLQGKNVSEDSPPELIDSLKKEYRKGYQKAYFQQIRKVQDGNKNNKKKVVYLRLSEPELQEVLNWIREHLPKEHSDQLAKVVREMLLRYCRGQYFAVDDERLSAIRFQIQKLGNNLNQWTTEAHRFKNYRFAEQYETMKSRFTELHEYVVQQLQYPPTSLQSYIHNVDEPDYLLAVKDLIDN